MTQEEDNIDCTILSMGLNGDMNNDGAGMESRAFVNVDDAKNQITELGLMLREYEITQEYTAELHRIYIEQIESSADELYDLAIHHHKDLHHKDLTPECIAYNNHALHLDHMMTSIVNMRNEIVGILSRG